MRKPLSIVLVLAILLGASVPIQAGVISAEPEIAQFPAGPSGSVGWSAANPGSHGCLECQVASAAVPHFQPSLGCGRGCHHGSVCQRCGETLPPCGQCDCAEAVPAGIGGGGGGGGSLFGVGALALLPLAFIDGDDSDDTTPLPKFPDDEPPDDGGGPPGDNGGPPDDGVVPEPSSIAIHLLCSVAIVGMILSKKRRWFCRAGR